MITFFLYALIIVINFYCLQIIAGIGMYIYKTWNHCDFYEDRWRFCGFGYHIKDSATETFIKCGFIK